MSEEVLAATCEAKHRAIDNDLVGVRTELSWLRDRFEVLSERAPKWATMWISILSAVAGGSLTLLGSLFVRMILP